MNKPRQFASLLACSAAVGLFVAPASAASLERIGTVFYIMMENHNWTQPNGNVDPNSTNGLLQVKGNPAAPFINSLIDPNSPLSKEVSYTNRCYNVLSTPSGINPSIHPSEPNYIWQEGGSNFGVTNDADPYKDTTDVGGNVFDRPSISGLLQQIGISWRSYQEGIDLVPLVGSVNHPGPNSLTNTVASADQWNVPLSSFSGVSPSYVNPYNGSHQYNFAAKHDGHLFFTTTNGGTLTTPDFTPANPESLHYAPLEALQWDLDHNQVAKYNVITPDQYNDMHTGLTGGFTYNGVHYTGDAAKIAQGDNFLRIIVPMIMASHAYKNNGMIVIWNDESERQNSTDPTPNDYAHSLMEIVISPLAKGHAYHNDAITYTHSSDIQTLQQIFPIGPKQGIAFLGQSTTDTAGNRDYADLFRVGRNDDDHGQSGEDHGNGHDAEHGKD